MSKRKFKRLKNKHHTKLYAQLKEERNFFKEENKFLREENKILQEKLKKIENRLKIYENSNTPPSKQIIKPKSKNKTKTKKSKGKKKGSRGGGIRLGEPDRIIEHKLEFCPISGKALGQPVSYRVKRIIELSDKPIEVIEHRILQYKSPQTGEIVEKDVDLGKSIYGKNLISFATLLKTQKATYRDIAEIFRALGAKSFSHTTAQNLVTNIALLLGAERDKLSENLEKEKFYHVDETPLSIDGKKGQVWVMCNKKVVSFRVTKGRSKKDFEKIGGKSSHVLVCDGYSVYSKNEKQRCWAHLLRKGEKGAEKDERIKVAYNKLKEVYYSLCEQKAKKKPPNKTERKEFEDKMKDIIECLEPIDEAKEIRTYLKNGGTEWFTALYYPDMSLDNNYAERELRLVVVLRKISGCIRNWKGKIFIENILSLVKTWKLNGFNVYHKLIEVQG